MWLRCQRCVFQVTIWLGVFPIVVSWWAALGLTVYFVATDTVLYYVKSIKHIEALWFANCANQLLFWTYIKVSLTTTHAPSLSFPCSFKVFSHTMLTAVGPTWALAGTAMQTLLDDYRFGKHLPCGCAHTNTICT